MLYAVLGETIELDILCVQDIIKRLPHIRANSGDRLRSADNDNDDMVNDNDRTPTGPIGVSTIFLLANVLAIVMWF